MQAVDIDIHAGKDLDDEGFQLTHPDLNNTEDKPMDATKIKVGDTVRLRNGDTLTVTEVKHLDDEKYPVEVCWVGRGNIYTRDGVYLEGDEDDRDILEIIPNGSNIQESGSESMNGTERDDIVVKPSHYTQFPIEPVTFVMENNLPFHVGNIIKYACRAGSKLYEGMDARESEKTDLAKVIRYAEMRMNQLEGKELL